MGYEQGGRNFLTPISPTSPLLLPTSTSSLLGLCSRNSPLARRTNNLISFHPIPSFIPCIVFSRGGVIRGWLPLWGGDKWVIRGGVGFSASPTPPPPPGELNHESAMGSFGSSHHPPPHPRGVKTALEYLQEPAQPPPYGRAGFDCKLSGLTPSPPRLPAANPARSCPLASVAVHSLLWVRN